MVKTTAGMVGKIIFLLGVISERLPNNNERLCTLLTINDR